MQETGNRDICFFNDRCYIPSTTLGDFPFNLLSSNIPYVLHGVIISVSYLLKERYCHARGHGGFYDYSLAYAIAWAFIFEGVFSTIYHVCPTRMIFQFDTAFMFVISAIIFICLLNHSAISTEDIFFTKHRGLTLPTRKSKSFRPVKVFAFFLAPILVFNYLGSVRDVGEMSFSHEVVFYVFLFFWYLSIIAWGLSKFGVFPKRLKLLAIEPKFSSPLDRAMIQREAYQMEEVNQNKLDGIQLQIQSINEGPNIVQLMTFHVFSLLLFIWLLHTIIARKDMSQFFLGSCVLCVFVALLSYEILIINRHPEEPRKLIFIFYVFVFVLWGAAGYFFVVMETTNKSKSPAANRDLNKECILAGFYDSHCVWHFLSSNALLLCALRANHLANPCRQCKHEHQKEMAMRSRKEAAETMAADGAAAGMYEGSATNNATSSESKI